MEFFGVSLIPLYAVLAFIVIDIITGICKAFATQTVSSSKMKSGMWSKIANILLITLAFAAGVSVVYFPELPVAFGGVYPIVAVYLCVMEIISTIENLAVMNPSLKIAKILESFGVNEDKPEE